MVVAQISIAGRTWTSTSRQFVTSRRSPLKSMTNAPTARASGAKILLFLTELKDRILDLALVPVADGGNQPPHKLPERSVAGSCRLPGIGIVHGAQACLLATRQRR